VNTEFWSPCFDRSSQNFKGQLALSRFMVSHQIGRTLACEAKRGFTYIARLDVMRADFSLHIGRLHRFLQIVLSGFCQGFFYHLPSGAERARGGTEA